MNRASRTRSDVGRVSRPRGAASGRPPNSPEITRIRAVQCGPHFFECQAGAAALRVVPQRLATTASTGVSGPFQHREVRWGAQLEGVGAARLLELPGPELEGPLLLPRARAHPG